MTLSRRKLIESAAIGIGAMGSKPLESTERNVIRPDLKAQISPYECLSCSTRLIRANKDTWQCLNRLCDEFLKKKGHILVG